MVRMIRINKAIWKDEDTDSVTLQISMYLQVANIIVYIHIYIYV